jgi:glycosyltransferase involved in cell wall biosynthesis
MRVMLINLGYPPNVIGGAELLVQSLAQGLVRAGIRTSVVSLSEGKMDWHYNDNGVRAYFIKAHPMGIALLNPKRTLSQRVFWHALGELNIWVARKLDAILDHEQPNIVNTHSILGLSVNAWHAVHARGIPVVHTLQDYQLLCPRGSMFRQGHPCTHQCRSCFLLTLRRRWASTVPSAVVGISKFILNLHSAHGYFPSAMQSVIPNSYRPPAVTEQASGAVTGPLRIGFIGRLHPTKGIELLLDSLKRLPRDRYIAKIAGSGSAAYEARLREMACGLSVDFLGWVRHDVFYDQIDVLVVPSVYNEPQGLVVVEAASFGVPTIYSDRGGLGEMGADFAGFLPFNPANPDSLSDLLLRLVETPSALRSLKNSIGPIPLPFKIEALVHGYQQLYEEILHPKVTWSPPWGGRAISIRPNI